MEVILVIRDLRVYIATAALLLCLCMPSGAAFSASSQPARPNVSPGVLVAAPDGSLWFTENRGIERLTVGGTFHLYRVPGLVTSTGLDAPSSLAIDKTGQVWFTAGQRMGRIDGRGRLTLYAVPAKLGYLTLFSDPQGQLWRMLLREPGNTTHASFARVTPTGTITPVFTLQAATLDGLTVARDGRFWFTETQITDPTQGSGPMYAGWILPDGRSARFSLPRTVAGLCDPNTCLLGSALATTSDGSAWFGYFGPAIGRVRANGRVTVYNLPPTASAPTSMVQGPDGALWFGTVGFGLVRIDQTGRVSDLSVGTRMDVYGGFIDGGLATHGLAFGKDEALWYTMMCQNSIGRMTLTG